MLVLSTNDRFGTHYTLLNARQREFLTVFISNYSNQLKICGKEKEKLNRLKIDKRELEDELLEAINENFLEKLIVVLHKYEKNGGTQKDAYETLKKIMLSQREENNNDIEELILELMDVVSGFCSQKNKIWKTNLDG